MAGVRGLLRDTQRVADIAPRPTEPACLRDMSGLELVKGSS
jgi:hypothetical protein